MSSLVLYEKLRKARTTVGYCRICGEKTVKHCDIKTVTWNEYGNQIIENREEQYKICDDCYNELPDCCKPKR